MNSDKKTITLSIVSHSQQELVKNLLNDIEKYASDNIKVIYTLNLDEQECLDISSFSFPIQIIKNTKPKGFAANHNQAFKLCETPYFCVVNPDIRFQTNPFSFLISALQHYHADLVAPKVLSPSGLIEDSVRYFPTPLSILRKLVCRDNATDYNMNMPILNPDWVGGMFMLFSSKAFRSVDGFDERYFLYYEDVDICRTFHRRQYKILFLPNASIVHDARRASHKKLKYFNWHLRSMLRFFIKWGFIK